MSEEYNGFQTDASIKYCGLTVEETKSERLTTVVLQGSKELLKELQETTYKVGTNHPEYGHIQKTRLFNSGQGPIHNLELTYSIDLLGPGYSSATGSGYGPKSSELSMNMLQIDLEKVPDYRKNWNYNLYSTKLNAALPAFWSTADYENDGITGTAYEYPDDGITDPLSNTYYEWAKVKSDLSALTHDGKKYGWHLVKRMTKPGVEVFSYPVYTLTEIAKHANKAQAAWIISRRAGRISVPIYGDFGIVEKFQGNWLCEGGSLSYDGRYWLATLNYTHSPNKTGWDQQLYDVEL